MSEDNPSLVYTGDELFLADCTPSNFHIEESGADYTGSFSNHSRKSNSNCGILAFYMLKFLLNRLLYNKTRYVKNLKFRALIRWKNFSPQIQEHPLDELLLKTLQKLLQKALKFNLKKTFANWAQNTKLFKLHSKFLRKKMRKEETHSTQVMQLKRVLAQMHLKKSEIERDLESSMNNEKRFREISERSGRNGKSGKKSKEAWRKVVLENEELKNTLEALNQAVCGLMKEMSGVLGEEIKERNESGFDDSGLRTSRRKKLSGIIG